MNNQEIIDSIISIVRSQADADQAAHDFFHLERVVNMSKKLTEHEGGDFFVIELAAWLHDYEDWKISDGSENGYPKTRKILHDLLLSEDVINRVLDVISTVSFKGSGVKTVPNSIEGKIVQDADRLDAIGAIGIARAFAFGGSKNRLLYDPSTDSAKHDSFDDYKKVQSTSINHFYEKLLLLKDRMNTNMAKEIAAQRHNFMETFLDQFYAEWKLEK